MSESATPAASGAVTPVTAVDDGDDPVAAVAAAEALNAQETPETLGSGLAKSVGLAFSAPTANLQGVFQLVFDVVQKQQVVIGSIREEMSAMQEEYPHRLTALEDEILDLRLKLEDANLRMDGLKGGTPAPAPAKYSVFVGNLPLDVDANDTASLLDSATFDDAMAASVEPPKSCDKWGAAHQIMHFDSVDTATSVAETLDGSEMASAPGNSAAAKVAMAVVLGVEPESRYERQILVRHVRDELAHNEVLAVVDEYIPEPEPSELDRYGLRLIRFPSRVEALKAASALTGLVVGRSRLEAAVVSAVDEVARLHESLHDLVPTDPDTRHRTLVVSSCAIGEEISGYTLGKEFEDVESSDLRPTENGQFNVGRVVFKTDAACEKARAKLEGLRLGGCSVAGLAIELPETEVLARRLSLVEALDEELLKPHVEDATRRLEKIEARNAGEHEQMNALHLRLDSIEELARDLKAKSGGPKGASKDVVDDLVDRVAALEKANAERPVDYAPPPAVETAPAGPDTAEVAAAATEATLAELERIGVLAAKESETIGRVYEVSEEILASTALKAMDEVRRAVAAHETALAAANVALDTKLGRGEFASLCERHAEPDNPLKPIFDVFTALIAPLEENKADRTAVEKRIAAADTAITARYEEAIVVERKRQLKTIAEVTSNVEILGGKVDVAERDVANMKQQLLSDKLQVHIDEQAEVDKDINEKIDLQHETMDKMRESLEAALKALDGTPNETTVRSMLSSLQDRIISKVGGANATLAGEIAHIKRDLPRKVAREDVLRMLAKGIKEVSEKLKSPDDSLMVGRVPYRCISCNQPTGMHGKQADKVVHAGLSPVSSTLPPDQHQRQSVVVQASYSTGRAGALRPLQRQSAPGIPISR